MRLYHELTPQERQIAKGLVLVKQSTAYIPNTTSPAPRRFEFIQVINQPILLGG